MMEKVKHFIQNPAKKVAVVKTKDYERVSNLIKDALININLNYNTEFKPKLYIPSQGLFTTTDFTSLEDFMKGLSQSDVGIVWLEEIEPHTLVACYHFCPAKLFILTPSYSPSAKEDAYVEVIGDDYSYSPQELLKSVNATLKQKNKKLFVEEDVFPLFNGLTSVEALQIMWDACLENNFKLTKNYVLQKKQKIFEKDHVLQLMLPHEVDTAVGLERVSKVILSCYHSGMGKGTLLLGIAGCGKTLLAENLAQKVPVIKFNLGRIYSKYVGESEERLESALQRLEAFGEGIVFIDEIEKALASTSFGNDGGVSMRVLGLLLGWMQRRKGNLYLMGTANRIDMLPPELIRPERWDFIFGITFPPARVMARVVEYYANKYELEYARELLAEEHLTPADVSSIYKVAKMTGMSVMEASRLVKRTRNLYPSVKDTLSLIEKFAVVVWDLEEQSLLI